MANIKEVAKDAKVSVATVSYVVNQNKYVSPELKEKVLNSIKKLNYNANPVARSLRNKKTHTIGVILQNIRNIFFPQLLTGLEEYTRAKNYNLMFFNTYNDLDLEKKAISSLLNMWVDGIILDSCVPESGKSGYIKFIKDSKSKKAIPIVLLERNLGDGSCNAVLVNNFYGGYIATKHLIETGKNKILHIAGINNWSMTLDRTNGYENAMIENGLKDNILIKYANLYPQDGYNVMKEVLMQDSTINGVFAANDQLAIGAMKAIKESGRCIPEDIGVVGFDNIFVSSLTETTLTTINVPKYEMGRQAAKLLIDQINGEKTDFEIIELPVNIIVRQSTDLRGEKNWELHGW